MSVFFWLIVLLAVYNMRIRKDGFFADYIDYRNIQPIKGIFILLIFISHFVQYVNLKGVWDAPYFQIRGYLGQLVVVPFLFYSGYGIAESIRQKGHNYVRNMPVHRMLKVIFQFDIAVVVYAVQRYSMGNTFGFKRFLLSLIGWESVGNSNWYIFAMLCMYLVTWLSYFVFRRSKTVPLVTSTVLTLVYIVLMKQVKDTYWCNTILAYTAGMWYSYYKEKLEKWIFAGEWRYMLCLAGALSGLILLRPYWASLKVYEIVSVLFAAVCVLITMKVQITNRFLAYCGEHLFSLFILQRLPMIAFNNSAIEKRTGLFFVVCLVMTLILSVAFDKFTAWLWNGLFRCTKAKSE